jgi:hypothetical protein
VRAPIALVDRQARHGRVARGGLADRLPRWISPWLLEHHLQGSFAEGMGCRGWVGAMAGAEVGKEGGRGYRVLAAGRRADPDMVGRVVEEEIHD